MKYILAGGILTEIECNQLISDCNSKGWSEPTIIGGKLKDFRDASVCFIDHKPTQNIIMEHAKGIADALGIDIYDNAPVLQVSKYSVGGHYDWHIDYVMSRSSRPPYRKMSLVMALDNSLYSGVELDSVGVIKLNPGDACLFSSLLRHRAPMQEDGFRHSLAVWVEGPNWR